MLLVLEKCLSWLGGTVVDDTAVAGLLRLSICCNVWTRPIKKKRATAIKTPVIAPIQIPIIAPVESSVCPEVTEGGAALGIDPVEVEYAGIGIDVVFIVEVVVRSPSPGKLSPGFRTYGDFRARSF